MKLDQELLQFIEDNRYRLPSISFLERSAGLPAKTIRHALNQDRPLPEKHLPALAASLKNFGYESKGTGAAGRSGRKRAATFAN